MAKATRKPRKQVTKPTTSKADPLEKVVDAKSGDKDLKEAIKKVTEPIKTGHVAKQPAIPKFKTRTTVDRELKEADEKVDLTNKKVDSLTAKLAELLVTHKVVLKENEDFEVSIKSINSKNKTSTTKLGTKITRLEGERAELSQQNEAKQRENTKLSVHVKNLTVENKDYSSDLKTLAEVLHSKIKSANAIIADKSQEISTLKRELNSLEGKYSSVKTKLADKNTFNIKITAGVYKLADKPWYKRIFIYADTLKNLI